MIPYVILIVIICIAYIAVVIDLYKERCLDFTAVSYMLLIVLIAILIILKLAKI